MPKLFFQAALVADALSLGPHWVYNQGKLARVYPDGITLLTDPASSYHPNRKAGQLTHYGDQMVLLNDAVKDGSYLKEKWARDWVTGMTGYDGYLDGASKETLASNGSQPSASNDLAGASRIAPILDLDLSRDEKVKAARSQTILTHGDPEVSDAAEFFVRAVSAIQSGSSFEDAFQTASSEGTYLKLNPAAHLKHALAAGTDALAVGTEMGLTCHTAEAFPLTLYFALREGATFASAMSVNGLAGGDTSARAMLLALLFAARDGTIGSDLAAQIQTGSSSATPGSNPIEIVGSNGQLAGVLEMPEGEPAAFAIFAHCFTCGKDFAPGVRISKGLAAQGIATLRIDFSGLGQSGGKFEDSSFLTNVEDLLAGAKWLEENFKAPKLLIGHSLGGAAVLSAAGRIESVKAVVTIGAPADPAHVTHLFEDHLAEIKEAGKADVILAGRNFVVGQKFLTDLEDHCHPGDLANLSGIETLIMHSPSDEVVPLENAGLIYSALRHPKSFISLAGADHLLVKAEDAQYVVDTIKLWTTRVLRN